MDVAGSDCRPAAGDGESDGMLLGRTAAGDVTNCFRGRIGTSYSGPGKIEYRTLGKGGPGLLNCVVRRLDTAGGEQLSKYAQEGQDGPEDKEPFHIIFPLLNHYYHFSVPTVTTGTT